jgi:3-methyladenine DNA glycosylase/8-oxoguanine DNA glycosylase
MEKTVSVNTMAQESQIISNEAFEGIAKLISNAQISHDDAQHVMKNVMSQTDASSAITEQMNTLLEDTLKAIEGSGKKSERAHTLVRLLKKGV